MIELKQIQARLKEEINHSGLSQSEIARRLNVNQSNVSHYVKGDKMPSLDTFANLCKILDADPKYILCLE